MMTMTASVILVVTSLVALCAVKNEGTSYLVFFKAPVPCAGTIIAPNWVITTAHCCHNSSNAKHYMMQAGSPGHYQHRQGETLYIHPNGTDDYPDEISKANDLALLKVTPRWKIGHYVSVIHMFFGSFPRYPLLNNGCFAAGWNRDAQEDEDLMKEPIPSEHGLTTVVAEHCRKKLNVTVYDNIVCAQDQFGSWDANALNLNGFSCTGDVGGPLVCDIFTEQGKLKPMLAGVMSSYEPLTGTDLCRVVFYAETVSRGSWIRGFIPHIETEGVDKPLRSRIMGIQDVAVSSGTHLDPNEYSLQVIFSFSGVTVLILHGAPARRLISLLLATLCFMRMATFLALVLNVFGQDRAWRRFGYIVSI